MNRQDILRRVGHMSQLADVKAISFEEGRAAGMKGWQVKNGPLQFTVMEGKCLDLAEVTYKGIQMNFLSKPDFREEITMIQTVRKHSAVLWAV